MQQMAVKSFSDTDNLTNCVISTPQNINYTFDGETLTLKAGSKIYTITGEYIIVPEDVSKSVFNDSDGETLIFYANGDLTPICQFNIGSGTSYLNSGYQLYWHLDEKCYYFDNGFNGSANAPQNWVKASWNTLPVFYCVRDKGKIAKLWQIFDWCGFIGDIVFMVPDVTYRIPNGKDENGNLINIEGRTHRLVTRKHETKNANCVTAFIDESANGFGMLSYWWYDINNNFNINTDSRWNYYQLWKNCPLFTFGSNDKCQIRYFTPCQTTSANLTQSQTWYMTNQAFPSDNSIELSIPDTGNTLTVPYNGWLSVRFVGVDATTAARYLLISDVDTGMGDELYLPTGSTGGMLVTLQVRANAKIQFTYNVDKSKLVYCRLALPQGVAPIVHNRGIKNV